MTDVQPFRPSWRVYAILLLLIIAGAYLRLANLDRPSFWVDEFNHVVAAQAMLEGRGAVFPSGLPYLRGMLYTKIVAFSFSLFGVGEFGARFFSAVFGVLTIPLVFFVAARLFRHLGVGVIAAFLQAFTPFNIGWSRVSRMYAIFQFFFLLAAYAIYAGIESERKKPVAVTKMSSWWSRLQHRLAVWNIDFTWLLIAALAMAVATYLQVLSGIILPGLLIYFFIMLLWAVTIEGWRSVMASKYAVFIVTALLGVTGIAALAPGLLAEAREAVNFSPNWARYDYVQNKFYYLWFLTSNFYFTIAAFFMIGAVAAAAERRRPAVYLLSIFVVALALLSTLFVVKVERYIFHLFPFYLIIAAYGAVKLFEFALALNREALQKYPARWSKLNLLAVAIVGIGILGASDWLRYARKIPSFYTTSNGAVGYEEWREACEYLRRQQAEGQPVVSTLPIAVHYYLGRVDYYLASRQNPRDDEIIMKNGTAVDYYSNARVIDTVEDLQSLMVKQPAGWLIVDEYRLGEERLVRPAVKEFIQRRLQCRYVTPEKSIAIYAWG
ncbi:MAG: glycosyltransferase family 39 protein [candidate division KSB1 bacterium]|nr:glycosyltransferase family 39 protein [candidate division KSB1 bacterium]MDZ7366489.1 glycosyltransferase family 39 protein [candidate division KSB1 bacterium]MDZ7404549.1 glycosyltransferase family 39 protein [candidate division KSB1 bacterium]